MTRSSVARTPLVPVLSSCSRSGVSWWVVFLTGVTVPATGVSLVAGPAARIEGVRDTGSIGAARVMTGAVDWVGDPTGPPLRRARYLDVQARGLVLARAQSPVARPGPARQQGAVRQVPPSGTEVFGHRNELTQRPIDQWRHRRDRPAGRRSRHPVGLGKLSPYPVPANVRQRDHHRLVQPERRTPRPPRTPSGSTHPLTHVQNLSRTRSSDTTQVTARPREGLSPQTRSSRPAGRHPSRRADSEPTNTSRSANGRAPRE
jgi:hypothetical protein